MDKERLKKTVNKWWMEWADIKGLDENTKKTALQDLEDVFALIDEALTQDAPEAGDKYPKAGVDTDADDWGNGDSRGYADGLQAQPALSEEVQRAIEQKEQEIKTRQDRVIELQDQINQFPHNGIGVDLTQWRKDEINQHVATIQKLEFAIHALKQMRSEPSPEDMQDAIDYFDTDFDYQSGCNCDICKPAHKHFDLVRRMLRQIQMNRDIIVVQMQSAPCEWCAMWRSWSPDRGGTKAPWVFCPSCSRELYIRKEDKE